MTRKPQPWYTALNPPAWSPKRGRNWKPFTPTHRSPSNRTDYHTGIDPAKDGSDTNTIWTIAPLPPFPGFPIHTDPPAIPYAGVRAGEITGHRFWLILDDLELCSVAHYFIWEPGATIVGDVDKKVSSGIFSSPIYGGTYSFATEKHLYTTFDFADIISMSYPSKIIFDGLMQGYSRTCVIHGVAIGTIKMWGEVVEHDKGYRAQYAKLTSIDDAIGDADIHELRRKYNV